MHLVNLATFIKNSRPRPCEFKKIDDKLTRWDDQNYLQQFILNNNYYEPITNSLCYGSTCRMART